MLKLLFNTNSPSLFLTSVGLLRFSAVKSDEIDYILMVKNIGHSFNFVHKNLKAGFH